MGWQPPPAHRRSSDLEEALAGQLRMLRTVPTPLRQHRFHATRRWTFDFAWLPQRIAVEVDGGTWSGGRHVTGSGFEGDAEKVCEAAIAGWRVLRVTRAMIEDLRAVGFIERALSP